MSNNTRTLDYYLSLPYTLEIRPDPTGGWVIKVKELPGCLTQADEWDDILPRIEEAKAGWLETALDHDVDIPEPAAVPQA